VESKMITNLPDEEFIKILESTLNITKEVKKPEVKQNEQ